MSNNFNDIKISVLMPVFNAAPFLENAISSILEQSHKNIELLACYDKSSDNSENILKKMCKKDARLKVLYCKNNGLVDALNSGLKVAKGKYIARMDADDFSLPLRLEKQLEFMEKNPHIGVLGTWVECFTDKQNWIIKYPQFNEQAKTSLLFTVPFAHPTVMMRADLLAEFNIKYDNSHELVEDYRLWVELAKYTSFANLPEVLLRYRHIETSLSKVADKDLVKRFESHRAVFRDLMYDIGQKNTYEEDWLHYLISQRDRIAKIDINILFLERYINKVILNNNNSKKLDEFTLKMYLYRRFLLISYYKITKFRSSFIDVFSKRMFYLSLLYYIFGKLKIK